MAQPAFGRTQSQEPGVSGSLIPGRREEVDQTCRPPSQFMRIVMLRENGAGVSRRQGERKWWLLALTHVPKSV